MTKTVINCIWHSNIGITCGIVLLVEIHCIVLLPFFIIPCTLYLQKRSRAKEINYYL